MPKFYKKSDLTFDNGYVLDSESNVVCLPDGVAEQLNDVETWIQRYEYLKAQPEECKAPSLDGFERESAFKRVRVKAETPISDKRVKESEALLAELRNKGAVDSANAIIEKYSNLFDWLASDTFVCGDKVVRMDLPKIGNPLEVDAIELAEVIASIDASDFEVKFE